MSQSLDHNITFSEKISEVLEDIGVNEETVKKRRQAYLLMENIQTVAFRLGGNNMTEHILGSQSEGSTTLGLDSDLDLLHITYDFNVMQDLSEWEHGKDNYLIIQEENVAPGYCFLQLLRSEKPLPAIDIPDKDHIRDNKGRILLMNTGLTGLREGTERHGPSNAQSVAEGFTDVDYVYALSCKSWPKPASVFMERQGTVLWPTSDLIRYATSDGCFVVGASSKISTFPYLEWRISTSLAERCLMFDLNLTQLHCYVLMKMILKVFLNPQKQNTLSSYMCKTVLFHCIENSDKSIWKRNNLSFCLVFCLQKLHSFIQDDNCPHFMIRKNNLMAGQFNAETKRDILTKISDIIQRIDEYLVQINIDDFSLRLQIKWDKPFDICRNVPTSGEIYEYRMCLLYLNLAQRICESQLFLVSEISRHNNIDNVKESMRNSYKYITSRNKIERCASLFIIPFLYSTFGSSLASCQIGQNSPVSPLALTWLSMGLNSDVSSGRLKLASIFFSTGDFCRAYFILRETEIQYHSGAVISISGCYNYVRYLPSAEFKRKCCEKSVDCLKYMMSFCIRFLKKESNCIPRELRYEMHRSTLADMPYRSQTENKWMNFAVIDSPTYLYFLQYKTYGHLQKYKDQQHALNNLMVTTVNGVNLGHKETAFNLLGQCMEQEGKPRAALKCYMLSLQQRARNNAAKVHICNLLAKLAFKFS